MIETDEILCSENKLPFDKYDSNMHENVKDLNKSPSNTNSNLSDIIGTSNQASSTSEIEQVLLEQPNSDCDITEKYPPTSSAVTSENNETPDEWLDIIGSGDFKKKILKPGVTGTRPKRGDLVTVSFTCCRDNGDVIEQNENLTFNIGDMDVIQGLDLAVNLMESGEQAKVLIPSRLAYGKLGRNPDIPPDCDLECDVELLNVKELDETDLTLPERLRIGNEKRSRGNFYYERGEFINALHCYEKASEYLDNFSSSSDNSNEEMQTALDVRIKIYNNMAATHLKLEAYDSALKSVEFVLKIQSKNVKAHFRKGKILAAKGLTDEAIASMKTAANLEPDSKDVQRTLTRLIIKKKIEEKSQKEMCRRMFKQDSSDTKATKSNSMLKKWSLFAGGVLAVAFSMIAYRQYHS